MARQSLTWTALPNGYSDDGKWLRLSVLLSPRLDAQSGPARLDRFFPDWEDWPATLAKATFEVSCNGASVSVAADGSAMADRLDASLSLADSSVWRAMFKADQFVRSHAFQDLSDHAVVSYDAAGLAERLQSLYAALAAKANGDMPLVSDFINDPDWAEWIAAVRMLDAPRRPDVGHGIDSHEVFAALARFSAFHTPRAGEVARKETRADDPRIETTWREHNQTKLPAPEDLAKQLDFHQIVSAMGSYPILQRKLGFVVDLLVSPDHFAAGDDVGLSVKAVFPSGTLKTPAAHDAVPVTRTHLSDTVFQAVSDLSARYPLKGRLLDLDPTRFALLQADVDGAGLKAMNFVRSLARRLNINARVDPVTRHEDEIGAPALRSAGLMLVQRDRGAWLTTRFLLNKARNAALEKQTQGKKGDVTLHAEDLVRGYRIDIWDARTAKWASLCRRTATYSLNDGAVIVESAPEEESSVRLAATTSPDPTSNPKAVSLHEALVTWTGWSLAAPPPGRNIRPDDSVDDAADNSEAALPPGLHFTSRFKPVKASLPRLRYGRRYWIRARAVDLAGNSLPCQPDDFGTEQTAANAQPFLRFEPVAPPALGLLSSGGVIETPGPGESMGRIAIRTFNDTAAGNANPSTEQAHRAALPPRVSARDVEHHGMLDHGGLLDAATFAMLANEKDVDGRHPSAVLREVKLPMQGPAGALPAETVFAVYEDGRSMTYLPDPYARSVAVRIFDHPSIDASEIIPIPLYADGDWPEARPFVLEIYDDATAKPHFDAASRRLRVPLPKAARARIRLSLQLDDEALATMGVYRWMDAAGQLAQRERARSGQHWMLTPWQVVEAVHAVQRPLKAPDITLISVLPRGGGATAARPLIVAQCSIASTDRLDLLARWNEPVSVDATPGNRQRNDVAFQVKITDSATYATALNGKAGGGFPEHTVAGPDLVGINALQDERVRFKVHEFHDTRYRRVEYWLDATTRFREFLPASLLMGDSADGPVPTDAHIKVTGQTGVTWIPSSAPPPAPAYLYAVPTFAWRRDADTSGRAVSERRGGIRVYLDRPWNVSGYGEMLAVVLPPAAFDGEPNVDPHGHPLRQYVTLWGNDPVWDAPVVAGLAPRREDFPLARTKPDPTGAWLPPEAPDTEKDQQPGTFKTTRVAPPGLPPRQLPLEVAPHDVGWDADRKLWYCDIEIATGGVYFPFIRLALARYQPCSIEGAHLSNIVLADFIALAPDRWIAIAAMPGERRWQVTVSGTGFRMSSGWSEASAALASADVIPAKTSVIEVWVERLEPRLGEDFGWKPLATAAVVSPGTGIAVAENAAEILWNGQVAVPPDSGGQQLRLVIAEYEEYIVDGEKPYDAPPTRKGRRMVFVEHYALKP